MFLIGTRGTVDSICPADRSKGTERGAEKDVVKSVQTRAVKLCIQGCAIEQLGEQWAIVLDGVELGYIRANDSS